ncbi:MAG TPA: DHA2 family efflux MFS transporter permease subunit [Thermoleophilaceae bacterium]|nr:DHA2 family efflux MFS transporter permease subunit [Thermoleophilaceae bacterium]
MTPADTPRAKNLALALLAMAQFVVVLDASIVNVALPSIGADLDFARDDLSWVVNSYTLFFGGFLLLGGRLADLLGRRRMFIWGMWLFALASLAGGLAQSDIWLVIARAVQGLGAALISPAALSIVTTTFAEGSERNKALGVWGAVAGSGGAAGVLLGGILTDSLGWEWVLFVNTPIGIAAAALAPRLLGESRDRSRASFDIAGAVSVTAGLVLLVYTLVDANDAGWGSAQTLVLGAVSVAMLAIFIAIEARAKHPLMPFSIFRLRTLRGANVIGLLIGMSLFSMFFFISLYMQQVMGYEPLKAGLAYLPLAGFIIVSAGMASQLVNRVGFKPILILGMVLVGIALVWFAQVSPGGSYVGDVLFPSLVAAVGLGFAFVPVTIAAVTGTNHDDAGLASGLINTSQQVGGALGLAILATVATSRTDDMFASGERNPAVALTEGFQDAFLVGAGFALLGALLAAVLISSRDSREQVEAARRGEAAPAAVAA